MSRLVSVALLALGFLFRPHTASCPIGYDLRTGVRADGRFECWSAPVGDPEYDGTWLRPERSLQRDDAIAGRVWCGVGERPVVVDAMTVRCVRQP